MKKTLLLAVLFISFLNCVVYAQSNDGQITTFPWSEGFEIESSGSDLPLELPHWRNFSAGTTTNRRVWTEALGMFYHTGINCASYRHDLFDASFLYHQDAWLVTPQIVVPANSNLDFTFWHYVSFADDYVYGKSSVLISTASATSVSDFTEVWTEDNPERTWKEVIISLAEYEGQNIYIAFRYNTFEGAENHWAHEWYVDDVSIAGSVGMTTFDNAAIAVYPNPSNGCFNIEVPGKATVTILDMTGKIMETFEFEGIKIVNLSYAPGVYLVRVESQGKIYTQKLVVN
ncbi:T9SS type A sorting domain-containing protein [Bacteroidales bacterium OttesenSCG-928-B11]|nr:T9SS type A sorting domain-containing protein [Bacteroidales bacterium OttesenSCG-928-E04]MDL2312483.1 T9SS type A sorting domain-containing protein [Bacteroidales bacterium OttesenSCG-928-B11]MDL2325714.1 T9SS type A sorting domain-containing protein [Bacteroidales bacterium OttesenSCG-928-A14]